MAHSIRQTSILFLQLLAFVLACNSASAEEAPPALVRVPVYFITDRNLESNSSQDRAVFGPHRKYIGDCKHDPYMGLGYCVVQNTSGKQITKNLKDLGWSPASKEEKEGYCAPRLIKDDNFEQIANRFYCQLSSAAAATELKEIVLFAHGYKTSFDLAFQTAARFSYQFEAPIALYSWPSVAKLRSYTSDETNNEWSQEHFNEVIENLERLCHDNSAIKLRIFAHSMGTRLAVRAIPFFREKPFISEVSLVCPDIDAGLVKHYTRRYLSTKGTTTIRLYMSQRDKALALSQLVHGGYCRLGECADSIVSMARNTMQLSAAPEASSAPESDAALEHARRRMQTIDFTEIDRGLIGHNIPVKLIYNFSYNGTPGDGLKVETESSGQRSKASRMLSRLTKLQTAISPPKENCLRIVKSDLIKTSLPDSNLRL